MKIKPTHHTTKFSWVQLVWSIIATLLFVGAYFAYTHKSDNMVTIAKPLGMVMLLAGALNLFVCLLKSHEIHGARWLIADGGTTVLLSIFPLFNQMIIPAMIPFFFGIWELFSGILKVMDSFELKEDKTRCFIGFAFIGLIELVSGTLSLIKPFDDLVGIGSVLTVIFIVQGCGFFLKTTMYKYLVR